jgi:large subunit ribosomal protein L23
MKEPFDQVQSVILTEKATLLSEKHNQYVFRVSPKANKIEIKGAVEQLFKKTVLNVNTANFAGKKKRERTASFGRRSHWKKAVITLKEGEKLDLI